MVGQHLDPSYLHLPGGRLFIISVVQGRNHPLSGQSCRLSGGDIESRETVLLHAHTP
jgi:hypothetical protein